METLPINASEVNCLCCSGFWYGDADCDLAFAILIAAGTYCCQKNFLPRGSGIEFDVLAMAIVVATFVVSYTPIFLKNGSATSTTGTTGGPWQSLPRELDS